MGVRNRATLNSTAMKKFSWEIVLAGFILVAVAIFLLEKGDSGNSTEFETASAVSQEEKKAIHIINLEGIEQLSVLEELRDLDETSILEGLKGLANLLPADERDEFLTEIDHAIAELEHEKLNISFDLNDKLVIVDKRFDTEAATWSETSTGVYTYFQEFDASSLSKVNLDLAFGHVKVVGSESSNAKITLQASGKIESESYLNNEFDTEFDIRNGEATIQLDPKTDSHNHNIQLQATLFIPESLNMHTSTDGGHIEVTNVLGDQIHETDGGHITLSKVGKVTAETEGGHISLIDGTGNFFLETEGGHITAERIMGSGIMETEGGNIQITEVSGEVTAETSGGNVKVTQSQISERMVLETSAGNIFIYGPKLLQAKIDFEASNGIEIDGFTFTGEKSSDKVTGSINGGNAPMIYADAGNGKVLLKAND